MEALRKGWDRLVTDKAQEEDLNLAIALSLSQEKEESNQPRRASAALTTPSPAHSKQHDEIQIVAKKF